MAALTRGDHDLVLLGADAQEGHVVGRVQRADGRLGLGRELRDERRVVHRKLLVARARVNGHALLVDDQHGLHTLVALDAFDRLLRLVARLQTRAQRAERHQCHP